MKLSIVIPAFNEEERLRKTLPKILAYFRKQSYSKEIIIVNDGSRDGTAELVKQKKKGSKLLRLVDNQKNQGKGGALRDGFAASKGEYVLFMDADLSTPLKELGKFWDFTDEYDIVIGSRKMSGAKITKRQNPIRENLGKIFTWLTNNLATKGLSDITCGFKLFKGSVGRELFTKGVLNDWSYDAEILFLAQKSGYTIKEVPVKWQNDPRTKVNMFKDGMNALKGLIKIRVNEVKGLYEGPKDLDTI